MKTLLGCRGLRRRCRSADSLKKSDMLNLLVPLKEGKFLACNAAPGELQDHPGDVTNHRYILLCVRLSAALWTGHIWYPTNADTNHDTRQSSLSNLSGYINSKSSTLYNQTVQSFNSSNIVHHTYTPDLSFIYELLAFLWFHRLFRYLYQHH